MATLMTYFLLVAAIVLIGRFFGNPKIGSNLLLVLVISVLLGLGANSFKKVVLSNTTKSNTEMITKAKSMPMQLSNTADFVTTAFDYLNGIAGKADKLFVKSAIIGEQLLLPNLTKNKDPCFNIVNNHCTKLLANSYYDDS